jgi:hypothetical protein
MGSMYALAVVDVFSMVNNAQCCGGQDARYAIVSTPIILVRAARQQPSYSQHSIWFDPCYPLYVDFCAFGTLTLLPLPTAPISSTVAIYSVY